MQLALCAILFAIGIPTRGQPIPPNFRGLSMSLIENIEVYYNPKVTKLEGREAQKIKALSTRLGVDEASRAKITIGQEANDEIDLHVSRGEAHVGVLHFGPAGGQLFIPGNNNVYLRNEHGNAKFAYRKGKLVEIKQPFRYVGLKKQVSLPPKEMTEFCGPYDGPKRLVLRQGKDPKSTKVATLAPGAEIEIILRDGDWFLIRTPFGLVGWATFHNHFYSLFGVYQSCAG